MRPVTTTRVRNGNNPYDNTPRQAFRATCVQGLKPRTFARCHPFPNRIDRVPRIPSSVSAPPVTSSVDEGPDVSPVSCGVLVVGGGPSGFCTAMMLAERGHKDIVILERAPTADWYDPTKAYMYGMDWRGKKALVNLSFPAVDDIGLTFKSKMALTYVKIDGEVESTSNYLISGSKKNTDKRKRPTWMTRRQLVSHLHNSVQERHGDVVKTLHGSVVKGVTIPKEAGQQLSVTVAGLDGGPSKVFAPKLLVAADGARSVVTRALNEAFPEDNYEMVERRSDAGGLAFKILTLPPNPELVKGGKKFPNNEAAVVVGTPVDGEHPLRIGLLPCNNLEDPRTANFILWPDHPFFKMNDRDSLFAYLDKAFPYVDFRGLISDEEATRFATAKTGSFPHPQSCQNVIRNFPDAKSPEGISEEGVNTSKGSGVVLVGDAMHSFPPDLGQGVNAAVKDVDVLRKCLDSNGSDVSAALQQFQNERVPESEALIRLMQIGYPFQYKQAGKKVETLLWTANMAMRVALNKVLPAAFNVPAVMMLMDASGPQATDSYVDIITRADATTRNIKVLASVLVAVALFKLGGVI